MTGNRVLLRTKIALAFVALVAVAGCAAGSSSEDESGDDVKVMLDYVFAEGYGRLAYGLEQGYFTDHDVNLEVTPGRGGDLALQQINSGKVDFAFADLSGYLAQRLKDETETTAVYAWINVPQICIASLEPIEEPEDMEGTSFTTVGFSSGRTTVPYVLKQNGVDTSQVDVRIVDISVLMSQLLSRKSDSIESAQFGSYEANKMTAEQAGDDLYCKPLEDWGYRDYGKLLLVRDDLIESDPDLVKRVVAGFDESSKKAMADASGEDIYEALKKQTPQAQEEPVTEAWESVTTELTDVGPIREADVAYSLKFLENTAGLTTEEPPTAFYDNSFIPKG